MLGMLEVLENELHGWDVVRPIKRDIIVSGEYFVIFNSGALSGGEVFMTEALELARQRGSVLQKSRTSHAVVKFMRRFKVKNWRK